MAVVSPRCKVFGSFLYRAQPLFDVITAFFAVTSKTFFLTVVFLKKRFDVKPLCALMLGATLCSTMKVTKCPSGANL